MTMGTGVSEALVQRGDAEALAGQLTAGEEMTPEGLEVLVH